MLFRNLESLSLVLQTLLNELPATPNNLINVGDLETYAMELFSALKESRANFVPMANQ